MVIMREQLNLHVHLYTHAADVTASTNGVHSYKKVHHHFLTCMSINVDVWQVVSLSTGSPSRLIEPAPSPGHDGITWLAWFAGSYLL